MTTRWKAVLLTTGAGLAIAALVPSLMVSSQNPARGQLLGPSSTGPKGVVGSTGSTGPQGVAGVNAFGIPNVRTLSLATAYQATDITKPAIVTVNLSSTASISLSGGTTNTASIVIGSTNAVASGTGTVICAYANSNTGTLTIGLGLNTVQTGPCSFALPTGWFWAVRQTAGTVTISSAFDQSVG